MLVITRKTGERVCIGDDITVTVLEIAGSTVRLGIEAPGEVPIYRHEIWVAVKAENRRRGRSGYRTICRLLPISTVQLLRKEPPPCLFAFRPTSRRSTPTASSSTRRTKLSKSMERLSLGLPDQPRRRRRGRPRDLEKLPPRSAASARPSGTRRTPSRSCRRPKARWPRCSRCCSASATSPSQYNNGTLSATDKAAITAEVAQLCAEIARIGAADEVQRHRAADRQRHHHLPGRRRRRPDDHRHRRQRCSARARPTRSTRRSSRFSRRRSASPRSTPRSRTCRPTRAHVRRGAEPARAHAQQPRHLRGEPPGVGEPDQGRRHGVARWSTSRSSRSSSRPAPRCSPRRTSPRSRCSRCCAAAEQDESSDAGVPVAPTSAGAPPSGSSR